MTEQAQSDSNILVDCWQSFMALPGWVKIWVAFILMPVNLVSLLFVGEPMGIWVAALANIAMMLNLPVMLKDRGFSKAMALPHLIPWTALVLLLIFWRPEANGAYDTYLTVLLMANLISLAFDYPDAISYLRGNRAVAGR